MSIETALQVIHIPDLVAPRLCFVNLADIVTGIQVIVAVIIGTPAVLTKGMLLPAVRLLIFAVFALVPVVSLIR